MQDRREMSRERGRWDAGGMKRERERERDKIDSARNENIDVGGKVCACVCAFE